LLAFNKRVNVNATLDIPTEERMQVTAHTMAQLLAAGTLALANVKHVVVAAQSYLGNLLALIVAKVIKVVPIQEW